MQPTADAVKPAYIKYFAGQEKIDNLYFGKHARLAWHAFSNTSFSPDVRAISYITEYSKEITDDLAHFDSIALTPEAQALLPDEKQRYANGFEQRFVSWLSAKSRCASTMITGPANFPVAQQEKRHSSERKRAEEFSEWKAKAYAAICTKLRKAGVVEVPELDQLDVRLNECLQRQALMKQTNSLYRQFKADPDSLENAPVSDALKASIRNWTPEYAYIKVPFEPYQLNSVNLEIKRIQERIAILSAKKQRAEEIGTEEIRIEDGWHIVINHIIDRLQIVYDGKPDAATISKLKSNGFKWAPSQQAWQRQLTTNAKWACQRVTGHLPK
ncbi:hypothetical protein [Spirosoma sp.]|uniref:hypothetical protein n=1 Tax=Spirosoma sp. TaxID=1899569 RepID=UPI002628E0A6|nr:hypothetical protein [Spirosoma sp.]MCX6217575.1 hypothetical protein [Spirosoma sp.]